MKAYKSPCVAVLGSLADVTAENYPRGTGVRVITDRQGPYVQIQIEVAAHNKIAVAYLNSLEAIDEVIGDLLAARADMVKLIHRKA